MTSPRLEALKAVSARLERERREAAARREDVASFTSPLDASIPAAWRTFGFAEMLLDRSDEILEANALRGLELAQLALVVCGGLGAADYPGPLLPQLEARAWKVIANAHRYRSQYDAALRALDAADRALDRSLVLDHDRAIIKLTRAVVFRELNDTFEASKLAREAAATFREHGDDRRLVQARLLEAMILQRAGNLRAAQDAYTHILASLSGSEDLHTLAATYNNLGQVSAKLRDVSTAVTALGRARELFAELGKSAEVVKVDWGLGGVLLATGDVTSAEPILARVRGEFLRLGMPEEAGLAALDLVEVYIATAQPSQAERLVHRVVEELAAAGLDDRALTALAYVRELPTPKSVERVRDYFERRRSEPALLFLPPVD